MARRQKRWLVGVVGLGLILATGCAFEGQHAFAATRKLVRSDAPIVTRIVAAPFVFLLDALISPVTAYMDAASDAPRHEHVYLSYVGTRALWASDLGIGYAIVGTVFVAPFDTVWFPVAATADTAYVLTAEEQPVRRSVPPSPPPRRPPATATGRRSPETEDPLATDPQPPTDPAAGATAEPGAPPPAERPPR